MWTTCAVNIFNFYSDSDLQCSRYPSGDAVKGERMQLTCSIRLRGLYMPLLKMTGPRGNISLTTSIAAIGLSVAQATAAVEFASETDGGIYKCTSDDIMLPVSDKLTDDSDTSKPSYLFAPTMCAMDIAVTCIYMML